jgi:hypothetical protein
MEIAMQYKTIVLNLLTEQTQLHEQLKKARQLLPTIETLAVELRDRHQFWIQELARLRPGSQPSQLSSEAMELAIEGLNLSPQPPA